jgi:hypothetical protein
MFKKIPKLFSPKIKNKTLRQGKPSFSSEYFTSQSVILKSLLNLYRTKFYLLSPMGVTSNRSLSLKDINWDSFGNKAPRRTAGI